MKKLLVLLLAFVFVLGMSSVALAGGWQYGDGVDIPGGDFTAPEPHTGYLTTTNFCKVCHAVHGANSDSYVLLRATSTTDACDYCHVGASPHTVVDAYPAGDTDAAMNAHTIGTALSGTPDKGGKTLTGTLTCNKCHSEHGAKLRTDTSEDILRGDPAGDSPSTLAGNENDYCGDCHYANVGGSDTHPYGGADSIIAWTGSPYCSSCHTDDADYPHEGGTSDALLGNGRSTNPVTSSALDDKCVDCHWNTAGDEGVGETF